MPVGVILLRARNAAAIEKEAGDYPLLNPREHRRRRLLRLLRLVQVARCQVGNAPTWLGSVLASTSFTCGRC